MRSEHIRIYIPLALALALALVACAGKRQPVVEPTIVTVVEPLEVLKPIPVKATPPAELLIQPRPLLPTFVPPSDPEASSALTVEGERRLRALIEDLLALIDAWKAWATAP